ncbi:MAG: nucleoid-associated protein, partial [Bacteroidales bacterium]|nr:nucleoid-associated protein [Bacteroidales bacterium]
DKYYNTHNVMSMYKNFVTKEMPQQFEMSKADQADLLNRSVKFFKENENFEMQNFEDSVIQQPEVIQQFQTFKDTFSRENDFEIPESFDISDSAVKKQSRAFKSVIKLDKNFHIYVHGNRNLIEQGEDEKGKFYKVYYKEEE